MAHNKTIRYEVKTFLIDCICGKCGRGRLRPSGESMNGKTPHACNHCKATFAIEGEPYPHTVVENVQAGPAGY